MINYQDIKIFNKRGHQIPLMFTSNIIFTTASNLEMLTDYDIMLYGYYDGTNKTLLDAQIINAGKLSFDEYNNIINSGLKLNCFVDGKLISNDINVNLTKDNFKHLYFTTGVNTALSLDSLIANEKDDVSVLYYALNNLYNGDNKIKIECDLSTIDDLLYPSAIFIGNVEIDKVSVGLVETETLIFGKVENDEFSNIDIDPNYDLRLITNKSDDSIKFLNLDYVTNEITKTDEFTLLDTDEQYVNIGFFPDQEGVHECNIWVCLVDKTKESDNITKIGQLIVTSEAVGYDERYKSLFDNFGILNPTTYYNIFKEHNPNEEKPDWELINAKSKELFLTYEEIFPYVGTYKALINAVDFLGYDDIYFREWFKILNDESDKEISYRININKKFTDIINRDGLDIFYRKLNKLTMVYRLHQETGEFDKHNIPIVDYVYDYSITEILTKLIALKEWLERNIISVNCKIVDITGEGVVYERLDYISYGTIMQNIDYEDILQVSPKIKNDVVKLIDGSAKIEVGNLISSVTNYLTLSDFDNLSISNFEHNNSTVEYPYISDFIVKGYIDTSNAIISDNVTKPLWINNSELYFLKKKDIEIEEIYAYTSDIDVSTFDDNDIIEDDYVFINPQTVDESKVYKTKFGNFIQSSNFIEAPIIHLQRGYIRNNYDDWAENIKYTILPDSTGKYSYALINDKGNTEFSYDYIILYPDTGAELKYTIDNIYNVPLFVIKNYKFILYNSKSNTYSKPTIPDGEKFSLNDEFILDIQDGKIINPMIGNKQCTINFHYDDSKMFKQSVTAAFEYVTSHNYYSHSVGNELYSYDEYCTLNVNNIGHYDIFVYAFNDNGNVFAKKVDNGCNVIMDKADIFMYTDVSVYHNDVPFYYKDVYGELTNNIDLKYELLDMQDNSYPILRDNYKIIDLTYGKQDGKQYIKYPSITYASQIAEKGDYVHMMNIVDKFIIKQIYSASYIIEFESYSTRHFNVFPKLSNIVDNYVNVIIYNKMHHKALYEFTCKIVKNTFNGNNGMIIDDNNKLILTLKPVKNSEFSNFIKFINVYDSDYNFEFYLQPATIYSIKSTEINNGKTKLYLNNDFDNTLDINKVFNVGDCVKVMYSINKHDDTDTYIRAEDMNKPKDEIEIIDNNPSLNITYYKSIDQYVDDNNIQYLKVYKLADNGKQYTGYTTYRIVESNNLSVTLNDKFNYVSYNESYLLSDIEKGDIVTNNDLKTHFPDKYIIRYGDENNIIAPIILKNEEYIYTNKGETYSFNSITTDIKIAKAHQAFVRYTLNCDFSQEFFNSYTKLYTEKSRLYSYLDNSFSFIISKFDQDNAYRYWNYNYKQPNNLYKYNEPITMLISKEYKNNKSKYTGGEVTLTSHFDNSNRDYTYWKVYKHDEGFETRTLMFEVLNNKLFLDIKTSGIYDIEAYNYDDYGNLSLTTKEAFICAK